jgi:hypothetical protein
VKGQPSTPRLEAMRFWWILANVVAWTANHKIMMGNGMQSTRDLLPMTIVVILDGLLTGIILGAGEWMALRQITDKADGWFHVTAWPQAFAVAVGWFLNIVLAYQVGARTGLPLLVEGSSTSVSPSGILIATMVGLATGISQWFVLRRFIAKRLKYEALWILGTVASLGVGAVIGSMVGALASFSFVVKLTGQDPLAHLSVYLDITNILGSAVMGLISGGMTSSILLLLFQHSEREPIEVGQPQNAAHQ